MATRENFLSNFNRGDEIYFGSNTNGIWEEDNTLWYNSFGLEQFYFDSVEDFLSFWYDEEDVNFKYSVYLGDRDENGDIVPFNGIDLSQYEEDPDEDGTQAWSKPVPKVGHHGKGY